MAVDKLVDSSQLNSDLTSVANAIRTKGGTSAQLAFPSGFVSAVEAIPTGGGGAIADYMDFSGGNILAIVGHGTEYISTNFTAIGGIYGVKLKTGAPVNWEHFFDISKNGTRTGLQRNNANTSILSWAFGYGNSPIGFTSTDFANGQETEMAFSSPLIDQTADLPLLIYAGYYNGSIESQKGKFTFYGLNIVSHTGEYLARFFPWLNNNVVGIKDLISGDFYSNAGTGAFDYIDLQGVTHNG